MLMQHLAEAQLKMPCHVADGYAVDSLNAHEMNELQRGPLGSTVALTIVPLRSHGDPQTVFLERRPLPQPPLKQVSTGDIDCSPNKLCTLSSLHSHLLNTVQL